MERKVVKDRNVHNNNPIRESESSDEEEEECDPEPTQPLLGRQARGINNNNNQRRLMPGFLQKIMPKKTRPTNIEDTSSNFEFTE